MASSILCLLGMNNALRIDTAALSRHIQLLDFTLMLSAYIAVARFTGEGERCHLE
jgi:hypothetical protein